MSQDKYIKRVSGNKLFRAMAIVALIIIVGLVIATFITGITGSRYFMGFLILSIIVPALIYVMLWIGRILYNSSPNNQTEAKETNDVSNTKE